MTEQDIKQKYIALIAMAKSLRRLNSHLQSQKCKKKPHPNDNYVIIGGRVYLKGESPLEGLWHDDHTPFDV